jgi:hypothetical protein
MRWAIGILKWVFGAMLIAIALAFALIAHLDFVALGIDFTFPQPELMRFAGSAAFQILVVGLVIQSVRDVIGRQDRELIAEASTSFENDFEKIIHEHLLDMTEFLEHLSEQLSTGISLTVKPIDVRKIEAFANALDYAERHLGRMQRRYAHYLGLKAARLDANKFMDLDWLIEAGSLCLMDIDSLAEGKTPWAEVDLTHTKMFVEKYLEVMTAEHDNFSNEDEEISESPSKVRALLTKLERAGELAEKASNSDEHD